MLIEIDENGFTTDGVYRLLPVDADINMYYAGSEVNLKRNAERAIAKLYPQEAHAAWSVMSQAFVPEGDYEKYVKKTPSD